MNYSNVPPPPPPPPPQVMPIIRPAGGPPTQSNYLLKNKNGYDVWHARILIDLKANGLLGQLCESDAPSLLSGIEQEMLDARAMSLIFAHLDDKVARDFTNAKSAVDLMTSIKTAFERKGPTDCLESLRNLVTLKYKQGTSMMAYISKFDRLVRDLDTQGDPFPVGLQANLLLVTLPGTPSFNSLVTTLGSLPKESLTLPFVKQKLLDLEGMEKVRGETGEKSTAAVYNASAKKKKYEDRRNPNTSKNRVKCLICDEGHRVSDCPHRTRKCFICGDRRHEFKRCPERLENAKKKKTETENNMKEKSSGGDSKKNSNQRKVLMVDAHGEDEEWENEGKSDRFILDSWLRIT